MALIINTTYSGITVNEAYARIEDFNGTKDVMDIQVVFYASHQTCLDGEFSFKREQYSFSPDVSDNSSNYHKQGYEYVKSLSEFEGAIDA